MAAHADVLRGSSHVPLSGARTRDEPLRTSAWEASNQRVCGKKMVTFFRFLGIFRFSCL